MITRLLRSWRKPEALDHDGRSRHHDMILVLRYLADHPDEEIWISHDSKQMVDELKSLVEACGGPENIGIVDCFDTPRFPDGRTWKLMDPAKAHGFGSRPSAESPRTATVTQIECCNCQETEPRFVARGHAVTSRAGTSKFRVWGVWDRRDEQWVGGDFGTSAHEARRHADFRNQEGV